MGVQPQYIYGRFLVENKLAYLNVMKQNVSKIDNKIEV